MWSDFAVLNASVHFLLTYMGDGMRKNVRIGIAAVAFGACAVLAAACSGDDDDSGGAMVTWTFKGIALGNAPAAGSLVEVFLLSNTASAVTSGSTDAAGAVSIDVGPVTDDWYARISGTGVRTTYIHFPEVRLSDAAATDGAALVFVPEAIWDAYHSAAGETPNPARAVVGVQVANLVSDALVGVANMRVAVTGSGNVVYVAGGSLDPSAMSTSTTGQAAIFRVFPGPVAVTASGGGIVHSRTIPTWPNVANNVVLQLNAP